MKQRDPGKAHEAKPQTETHTHPTPRQGREGEGGGERGEGPRKGTYVGTQPPCSKKCLVATEAPSDMAEGRSSLWSGPRSQYSL